MKVRELIEELSKQDLDAEAFVFTHSGKVNYVEQVKSGEFWSLFDDKQLPGVVVA